MDPSKSPSLDSAVSPKSPFCSSTSPHGSSSSSLLTLKPSYCSTDKTSPQMYAWKACASLSLHHCISCTPSASSWHTWPSVQSHMPGIRFRTFPSKKSSQVLNTLVFISKYRRSQQKKVSRQFLGQPWAIAYQRALHKNILIWVEFQKHLSKSNSQNCAGRLRCCSKDSWWSHWLVW